MTLKIHTFHRRQNIQHKKNRDMPASDRQNKSLGENTPRFVGIKRWDEVAPIICDNAFSEWKTLAQALKVESKQIAYLSKSAEHDQEKCWKVLAKWYEGIPRELWPVVLKDALKKCRLLRLADILERLLSSLDSIEKILAKHEDREERMRQAMYCMAERTSSDWRTLAKKLGLSGTDVADIENRFNGRPREKCMHALYKWRLMVPLQDFKVTSLIQAARLSNLNHVAVALLPFAEKCFEPVTLRKKRSGEVIIHVGVKNIDIQRPDTKTNTSYLFTRDVLRDYVLNKIFLHLLDGLDAQCHSGSLHPLIAYLQSIDVTDVTLVSRAHFAIIIDCGSKENLLRLYELSCSGELDQSLTECLVSNEILVEMTVENIELQAEILSKELITPAPSMASTARSVKSATRSDVTTARSEVSTARSDAPTARSEVSTARSDAPTSRSEVSTARSDAPTARSEVSTARSDASTAWSLLHSLHSEDGSQC